MSLRDPLGYEPVSLRDTLDDEPVSLRDTLDDANPRTWRNQRQRRVVIDEICATQGDKSSAT